MTTRSLLLLCYPRSLSNFVYATTRKALAHQLTTGPTPGGELLTLFDAEAQQGWRYYATYDLQYRRCCDLLFKECSGDVLIKDVMQPFILSRFVAEYPDFFNVLTIRRPLPDIIYCLLSRRWFWSLLASHDSYPLLQEYRRKLNQEKEVSLDWIKAELLLPMTRNLVRMDRDIYGRVSNVVDYEKLVLDHHHLFEVLAGMGYDPRPVDYIDDAFKAKRDAVQLYKDEPLYREIESLVNREAFYLGRIPFSQE